VKKLPLLILFTLIGLGTVNSYCTNPGLEAAQSMFNITGILSTIAASSYGLGKFCHYKSSAPRYDIDPFSSYFHNHGNYPAYFHGKNSTAPIKQKVLSRTASLLLKTGSGLKVPCCWLGFITLSMMLNS